MCIIVVKKAGIATPSEEMFENMWNHNPDGAGFMYTANGGVCIEKGFMEYKDFYKAYKRVEGKIDTVQTPMVFHFRITTHGGTSPENTHPFPVTDNLSMLRKLMCKTSLGVAHNGILSVQPRSGISDTMEYILTQLSTMKCINKHFPQDKYFRKLIENEIGGSRLAFLDMEGNISTVGDFVTDEQTGLMFSNTSCKTPKYWTPTKSVCDIFDLGGTVTLDGNKYSDYGEFYVDKKGNVYGYNWEDDMLYPSERAELEGGAKYDSKLAELMPYCMDISFEELLDYEDEYDRCYWCGEIKCKDKLEHTEIGMLCEDCMAELER